MRLVLTAIDDDGTTSGWPPGALPLTASTPVHVAGAHLRNRGETAAVVFRAGRPVGVVTEAALERARSAGRGELPLARVMDYVTVPVAGHTGEPESEPKAVAPVA